jgi:hypothetical protein
MELDILKMALEHEVPALEERSDGAAQKEREYVFYARLKPDFVFPQTGNVERQEQWTIKIEKTDANGAKGDIRVRKTDFFDHGDLGKSEYVLTTKIRLEEGVDEIPIPSTADQFEHFKKLAESGMIKDRYTYTIDASELVWEVDAYLKPGGGYHPWVKIDLEVPADAPADFPIPEFPFEAEEWIKAQNGERNAAEEAQVRQLYETMFLTKNPAAKSMTESGAAEDDVQDDEAGQGPKPVYHVAKEGHTNPDWQAGWPELEGVPMHPDLSPTDEIYQPTEDGEVRSEPDETRTVVGVEQIQEFNSKVEQLAKDMGVRLLHLSIGRGYLPVDEMMKLATAGDKSPEMIPIAQGGPYGSQYYYVKNPTKGSNVVGAGFKFTHPTLLPDQVHF